MDQCRTEACHKIEYKEFPRSPDPFEHRSEYVQGVHVEEKMPEASVHEHMRHRLPPVEERRCRVEKREGLIHEILIQHRHDHDKDIDDDDVLYGCRYIRHETSPASVVV